MSKKMKFSYKKTLIPILILLVILTVGIVLIFSKQKTPGKVDPPKKPKPVSSAETQPPVIVKQPTSPLGIYVKKNKTMQKYDTIGFDFPASDSDKRWMTDTWTVPGESHLIYDLAYFNLIPSADSEVSIKRYDTDWLNLWKQYYGDRHRIGYEFKVLLKSGEIKHLTVRQTRDTMKLKEYFELYLYDGVYHAKDSYYSHTTQSEFEKRDIVYNTSIKITLCNKCYEIDRIEMTGFIYSDDSDFDKNGSYIGADKVTCTIFPESSQEPSGTD